MEKIFVVGSGAIGKALAAFLKLQEKNVIILRGSVDNVEPCHEDIEVSLADGTAARASVEIRSFNHFDSLDGVIVLTNKSFGNPRLASLLKTKTENSPIVLLQNGLYVEDVFIEHFHSVLRCVLFATSQVIAPGKLRFKPVSVSPIGVIKGNESAINRVVEALDSPHFRFSATDRIEEIVWRKVIANCVFNSICPLLDTDNGIFHRDPEALNLAKAVIAECVTIARAKGLNINENEIAETVLLISKSSDGQLISTLQDIKNGKETEIKSLNFAVVKVAQQLNLGDQVAMTRLLGELTFLKSRL